MSPPVFFDQIRVSCKTKTDIHAGHYFHWALLDLGGVWGARHPPFATKNTVRLYLVFEALRSVNRFHASPLLPKIQVSPLLYALFLSLGNLTF